MAAGNEAPGLHAEAVGHLRAGRVNEAIEAARRAVGLRPDDAGLVNTLGECLRAAGRIGEAIEAYRRTIDIDSSLPEAHYNLGLALEMSGHRDEAMACWQRALELRPTAEAWNAVGAALGRSGFLGRAEAAFRSAVELRPDFVEAQVNLGLALHRQRNFDEAIAALRQALQLDPNIGAVCERLGGMLREVGDYDQAIGMYREALRINPADMAARDSLLLSLHYDPGIKPEVLLAEHREWDRHHAPAAVARPARRAARPKIRIGYVSGDLREHSIGYFIEPLLANHDRERFEVYCYNNHWADDAVTKRLRGYGGQWREVARMTDEAVARLIREDGIDVLIDLAGHTGLNRLRVFARRSAAVQINYLGYPGTTGLASMDYRLSDRWADPPGVTESHYSETLIRLERCAWCYRPPEDAPAVVESPALAAGHVTFGSFNAAAKISPQVLDVWSRILAAVPDSRLLLKSTGCGTATGRERLAKAFAARGIGAERLILLEREPAMHNHLGTYARVDIALDTFPYNGVTTTCEALWMGAPVVALAGERHSARVGVSLLTAAGMGEYVGNSLRDYERIAVMLAGDLARLSTMRREMRPRMAASALLNGAGLAREIEKHLISLV